jgi:hypothetical protein
MGIGRLGVYGKKKITKTNKKSHTCSGQGWLARKLLCKISIQGDEFIIYSPAIMANTKGSAFVALKSFVTRRFGHKGWKRYLSCIEPKERNAVEMPSTKEWYDLGLWIRSLHVLKEVFGDEEPKVVYEFGRHEASRDLSTWQRLFLRTANPAYVLEKATEYWCKFCDFGSWKVERKGNKAATATLRGVPVVDALYCEELTGYLNRLFELVGAKNLQLEHSHCHSRSRGGDSYAWNGSWD